MNHDLHTRVVVGRADLLQLLPGLDEAFTDGKFLELGWGDASFYQTKGRYSLA